MNTAQLKQEKTPLPKEKCLNKTLCYKITSYDIIVAEFPMGGKIIPQNKTFFLLVFLLLSLSLPQLCVPDAWLSLTSFLNYSQAVQQFA